MNINLRQWRKWNQMSVGLHDIITLARTRVKIEEKFQRREIIMTSTNTATSNNNDFSLCSRKNFWNGKISKANNAKQRKKMSKIIR